MRISLLSYSYLFLILNLVCYFVLARARVYARMCACFIALQCAKLLGDTSVIKFYPSKFVLITDILDTFGKCRLRLVVELCGEWARRMHTDLDKFCGCEHGTCTCVACAVSTQRRNNVLTKGNSLLMPASH